VPTVSGPMIRSPLLLCEPDGRLHVICGGVHWRATAPGSDADFEAAALPRECGAMIYVNAAMNERGDLLLVFPHNRPTEDEQRTLYSALLPHGERRWIVRKMLTLPFRHCYPTIHFRASGGADVVLTGDIIERGPQFRWRTSTGYRYRLCSLTHVWTDDVTRGDWQAHQFETYDDGWIFGTDIQAMPDGVHFLGYGTRQTLNVENPDEPLPDASVMHWRTASRGGAYECQTIERATGCSFSRFSPAAGSPGTPGGWRYLLTVRDRPLPHPHGNIGEVLSVRLATTESFGQPPRIRELDFGQRKPIDAILARPERFGGVSKPGTLDALISDPWAHTSPDQFNYTNPGWDALHAEVEV
jgi:hypothetical protein